MNNKRLKAAAIYLIIAGGLGLIWHLLGAVPLQTEFESKSQAFKFGAYARTNVINILFLISGAGILAHKSWARTMAMVILLISIFYSTQSFAWGFAGGQPSQAILITSFIVLSLWNGMWLYFIYQTKHAEIINKNG